MAESKSKRMDYLEEISRNLPPELRESIMKTQALIDGVEYHPMSPPVAKGQKKSHSLFESLANIVLGYGIAIGAQVAIFPLFGINIPLHDNLEIGAMFTVVSLIRSYTLRRLFNWFHVVTE